MPVSVYKKAIRCLGIAESFVKGVSKKSVLAGVVMRTDLVIDGFSFARITVGGMDATKGVIEVYEKLKRKDINLMMLNGCIISWYNVIDLPYVYEKLKVPLICVTYEESKGIEEFFRKYFEDAEERIRIYRKNGERIPIKLKTGHKVYVRFFGLTLKEVKVILNRFTRVGSIPEPLRVAKLLARSVLYSFSEN